MPINPLQLSAPQAWSGGADFTPLANLRNVYMKALEEKKQSDALAMLGQGRDADQQTLLKSGVPSLANLGLTMQEKGIDRSREDSRYAVSDSQFAQQQRIRDAADRRQQSAFDEDTPTARARKLVAAGLDPKDPAYAAHIATGAALPSSLQQSADARAQSAEKRAQTVFEQEQLIATPEGRKKVAGEAGLDVTDPGVKTWIAAGGDITKARNGLGQPLFTQDEATGKITALQLSSSGPPVPVQIAPGQRLLGPGEIAQQKAVGTATGKGEGGAKVGLADVVRTTDQMVESIDKLIKHESKGSSLGLYSAAPDWMVMGTGVADFRERVAQLAGEAMQQNMSMLRGAGLGSVSDFEQQNMIKGFLRASQAKNQKDFDEGLADAKRSAEKIREIARARAKGDFSERPYDKTQPPPNTANRPPLTSIFR